MAFWAIVAAVSTFVLALAAIIGAILALKNLYILREQHRRNTFLNLINEISNERGRENRAIIHECIKPDGLWPPPEEIPEHRVVSIPWMDLRQIGSLRLRGAFEETIVCFDKVGFFLLRGDPRLRDEAPVWIWTITKQMWEKLGAYVKCQQNNQHTYGQYLEELSREAQKYVD